MNEAKIPPRWLPLMRILWFAVAILFLVIFTTSLAPLYNEVTEVCHTNECNTVALSQEEVDALQEFGFTLSQYAVYITLFEFTSIIIFIPLAALIFWRRSDAWIGYLLSLILIGLGTFGSLGMPALGRLYPELAPWLTLLDVLFSLLFVMLIYLFPDGRFVPRWTRILVVLLVIGLIFDVLVFQEGQLTLSYGALSESLWLGSLLVGVLSQIYRYLKISTPVQRQQTKWIVFGLAVAFIPTLIWTLLSEILPLQPGPERLLFNLGLSLFGLLFYIFPLSIAFSILQYRLWDIDIVINRSLVYGLLTGVLALIYLGSVVLLQAIFRALTDQSSPIAIVISTLVIAALFSPLRRWVQEFIDRRFYRQKYNAEQILEQFAASVRDEPDLNRLTAQLQAAAMTAMQAEHVSIWLREPEVDRSPLSAVDLGSGSRYS